jgi:hypothetical protein
VADDLDQSSGEIPKLTIGQRLLAALPSLDRRSASPPRDRRQTEDGIGQPEAREQSEEAPRSAPPRAGTTKIDRRPDPTDDMTNEQLTAAIKRIDDREKGYAIIAGVVGAVLAIPFTILAIHTNPPLHHKGHVANSVTLAYGAVRVVLGGAVALLALSRRRSLVAFGLLFLGTAEGFPTALLFWALGGWIIWRVFRYQKVLSSRGAGPQRARVSQGPKVAARSGASDARARAQARRDARDRRRRKEPVPTGPAPSKRYTPKKPVRPRPQPPA